MKLVLKSATVLALLLGNCNMCNAKTTCPVDGAGAPACNLPAAVVGRAALDATQAEADERDLAIVAAITPSAHSKDLRAAIGGKIMQEDCPDASTTRKKNLQDDCPPDAFTTSNSTESQKSLVAIEDCYRLAAIASGISWSTGIGGRLVDNWGNTYESSTDELVCYTISQLAYYLLRDCNKELFGFKVEDPFFRGISCRTRWADYRAASYKLFVEKMKIHGHSTTSILAFGGYALVCALLPPGQSAECGCDGSGSGGSR